MLKSPSLICFTPHQNNLGFISCYLTSWPFHGRSFCSDFYKIYSWPLILCRRTMGLTAYLCLPPVDNHLGATLPLFSFKLIIHLLESVPVPSYKQNVKLLLVGWEWEDGGGWEGRGQAVMCEMYGCRNWSAICIRGEDRDRCSCGSRNSLDITMSVYRSVLENIHTAIMCVGVGVGVWVGEIYFIW